MAGFSIGCSYVHRVMDIAVEIDGSSLTIRQRKYRKLANLCTVIFAPNIR